VQWLLPFLSSIAPFLLSRFAGTNNQYKSVHESKGTVRIKKGAALTLGTVLPPQKKGKMSFRSDVQKLWASRSRTKKTHMQENKEAAACCRRRTCNGGATGQQNKNYAHNTHKREIKGIQAPSF
jgi:hypothetical protein